MTSASPPSAVPGPPAHPRPAPPWQVVAASVRGRGHEKSGQPCQDASAWHQGPDGTLIAAVADGAGSARLGEVGSETAARRAIAFLTGSLQREGPPKDPAAAKARLKAAFDAALKALTDEAATRQARPAELATTLLLAVASADGLAAAQVGDGAVVFSRPDGGFTALTRPIAGEYLNETVFLTSEGALDRLHIETWSGAVNELALFSDGLQMLALKMPEGSPHAPFFQPLFRWLASLPDPAAGTASLEAFLRSPRVGERTDDDLTLLLARRPT